MMNKILLFVFGCLVTSGAVFSVTAQTVVTDQYLTNAGFDTNFNYDATTTGNVAGDIINNVSGWTKDIGATYTVAGTFAYGSGATFNNSSAIPSSGYLGSTGGGLALTTGWGTVLKYSQSVTLPSGKYSIASAYYNAGTSSDGSSIVGWVPEGVEELAISAINSFPVGTWITDTITFYVLEDVEGKIQVGFQSKEGAGSSSHAKILIDYIHLHYYGIDKTVLNSRIAEAEAVYGDGSGIGADVLLAVISSAKDIEANENASMADVVNAIDDLENRMEEYHLNNASGDNPLDMTDLIVNPIFEDSFTDWINDGMSTQTNAIFPLVVGTNYVEKWVSRGAQVPDVSIQQLVTDIPNGKYSLHASAGNIQQTGSGSTVNVSGDPQTGAYLFAGYKTTPVNTIEDYSVEFMVFDNQILIGFKTESCTGNWVTLDNFRLHYEGFNLEAFKIYVEELISEGQLLLGETMLNSSRDELELSIAQAQQATTAGSLVFEDLQTAHANLLAVNASAKVSIEVCSDLQMAIDNAEDVYADGSGNEAALLNDKITEAKLFLSELDGVQEAAINLVSDLHEAVFAFQLANASGTVPTVVTNKSFARGATAAFGRSTITGVSISNLAEHGFCWSTDPEPTIFDNRTTKFLSRNGYIYHIQNLEPSTVYYMRAYAISKTHAVGYGDVIKVITIPKGTITYQLNASVTNAEGHHERIAAAMASAVGYWNNLTSIQGKHLSINYHPGTPTAEASYNGYMQFGPNPAYQQTGTAMHEMGHNIGIGQHSIWYGPNSPLREQGTRGVWLGERANKVLQFIDNNPNVYMSGDHIHMWPYGINGAHEDNGTELLYIANSLITQALCEDGLPPAGGFSLPAYTFESEPGVKYYIKNEAESMGRDTRYLRINKAGRLYKAEMSATEAVSNDSAAWFVEYNPVTSYYRIRNVATGKYFSYTQAGIYGIGLLEKTNPGNSENFQLMSSRSTTQVGSGENQFSAKGYWIVRPEHKLNPLCFAAMASGATSTAIFNISDASTTQRWLLLTSDEAEKFSVAGGVTRLENADLASMEVYSQHGKLHIENMSHNSNVIIYDISGRMLKMSKNITGSYSCDLPKGIYIIAVQNGERELREKIVM